MKLGVGMAVRRQDRLYKDYTSAVLFMGLEEDEDELGKK